MKQIFLAGLVSLSLVSAAQAGMVYNATYTNLSGGVIEFTLDGDLQPDGDTVLVNSLLTNPTYNGVDPMIPMASFDSASNRFFGSGVPATLSLSGTTIDFIWSDPVVSDGFLIDTTGQIAPDPVFAAGNS